MNGLSRDARALLARARSHHEPTENDRETVLRGLAPKLPAAAALAGAAVHASSVAASTAPVAAASASLVGKWLVGGLLVGVLGLGSGSLIELALSQPKPRTSSAPVASAPSRSPRSPSGSGAGATTEPVAQPPAVAPSARSTDVADDRHFNAVPFGSARPKRGAAVIAPAQASSASSGHGAFPEPIPSPNSLAAAAETPREPTPEPVRSADLLAEARALREAQTALDKGHAREALSLVEAQSQKFASGELQEERNAARLLALCALGEARLVAREVAAFLQASPASPLAPRVRKACRIR